MRSHVGLWVLTAILLLAGSTASSEPVTTLPEPVQRLLSRHKLAPDNLSIYVQDVTESAPLLTYNAQVARNPASVMKLVTTFVALHELGPAFSMRSDVFVDALPVKGKVQGNLYLKGRGDPFLVTESFWRLLKDLRHIGVEHVTGDLVIDGSYFDVPDVYRGDFDGRPHRAYNVAPHATLVNFFATTFKFFVDEEEKRVRIVADPPMATLELDNQVQLTDGRCSGSRRKVRSELLSLGPVPKVRFTGSFSKTCNEYRQLLAVAEPAPYVFGAFKPMWQEMGGRIDGTGRIGIVPESATRIHHVRSRPLAELVRFMNKYSNNVMTRNLLLVLGARTYGAPGTEEKGRRAIADWLLLNDIAAPELRLENGSGLSRKGQISALTLARMLLKSWQSEIMPEFVSTLPLSSVDGTLRKRLRKTDLEGKAHMKTGLLNGVRTIAGFVRTRSGRNLVAVSLQNEAGVQNGSGTAVQDALLEWLYEHY